MKRILLITWIALLPLAAVGSTIDVDFDRSTDFSAFETFSWSEGRPVPNPSIDRMIVDAVVQQLEARGLTQVDEGGDLAVAYYASVEQVVEIETWRHRPRWRWADSVSARTIPIGTIIVDLVDPDDLSILWRGVASDSIATDYQKNAKRIAKAAEKMFRKLPIGD